MLQGTMPAWSTHDYGSDMTHQYAQPYTDQLMNKLLNCQASLGKRQMAVAGNVNSEVIQDTHSQTPIQTHDDTL